jgi:hypothetical protein
VTTKRHVLQPPAAALADGRLDAVLGRYLLEGEGRKVHALACVLNGNATDSAFPIKIQKCVFIEVTSFRNLDRTQFNVESVCILIVFNLHGVNDRSKKALCTVSASDNSITLRYFSLHFWNLCPPTNSSIRLNLFLDRLMNHLVNPFQSNFGSILPKPRLFEVSSEFHGSVLRERGVRSSLSV